MRALAAVIALAACSSSQHSVVDRTACESCHVADYDTAANPPMPSVCTPTDHVALGYGTTCADCHGTVAWCPADASHTRFDLTSPSHEGWDCADCHTAISYDPPAVTDPKAITCTSCHWHTAGRTDPKHLGNGDYSYAPMSCLECHRGGRR